MTHKCIQAQTFWGASGDCLNFSGPPIKRIRPVLVPAFAESSESQAPCSESVWCLFGAQTVYKLFPSARDTTTLLCKHTRIGAANETRLALSWWRSMGPELSHPAPILCRPGKEEFA